MNIDIEFIIVVIFILMVYILIKDLFFNPFSERKIQESLHCRQGINVLSEALYACHSKKSDKILYQAISYLTVIDIQPYLQAVERNDFDFIEKIISQSIDEIKKKRKKFII